MEHNDEFLEWSYLRLITRDNYNTEAKAEMETVLTEKIHEFRKTEDKVGFFKEFCIDNYVVKEENISEDFVLGEEDYWAGEGFTGDALAVRIDSSIDDAISSQKYDLKRNIDFLLSSKASSLESWQKVFAFEGMLNAADEDYSNGTFTKRDKTSAESFIPLDYEDGRVLFDVASSAKEVLGDVKVGNNELDKLANEDHFSKSWYGSLRQKKSSSK